MNIFTHDGDLPSNIKIGDSVAIDTEAMGLCPYRDRLCLVQLRFKNSNDCHLIQFSNSNDYQKAINLKSILLDKKIMKIFHYARFDMMMLYRYLGTMAKNIYCTKIASKLTRTYANSHSLLSLCEELLGVVISKEETCTDWGASVLTEQQKKYAATDVFYLHSLKEKLDIMLKRENREEIAKKCFDFLDTRVVLDLLINDSYDIFCHS